MGGARDSFTLPPGAPPVHVPSLRVRAAGVSTVPLGLGMLPGDVERFDSGLGPFDRSALDVVIEVRSKWLASRADKRQERIERLHADIEQATGLDDFGVDLSLPVAAWDQSEPDRPAGQS